MHLRSRLAASIVLVLVALTTRTNAATLPGTEWEATVRARLKELPRDTRTQALAAALALDGTRRIEALLALADDPEVGDVALWLAAGVSESSQLPGVSASDRAARLSRLLVEHPRSTLQKPLPRKLALAELDTYATTKSAPPALAERALARLETTNELDLLEPSTAATYLAACKTDGGDRCRVWVEKLRAAAPPKSDLARTIRTAFPEALPTLAPVNRALHATKTPTPREPDIDAFDAAFAPWLEGQAAKAVDTLTAFLAKWSSSPQKHRARFWLGRALAATKRRNQAEIPWKAIVDEAPLSPYAVLAAYELGVDPAAQFTGDALPERPTDAQLPFLDRARIRRTEQLLSLGLDDIAQHEIRGVTVRPETPNATLSWLAALAHLSGAHLAASRFVGALSEREGADLRQRWILDAYFPQHWLPQATEQATARDTDPLLVLSLIQRESASEPEALSSVGAQGLMQLMPATAASLDPAATRSRLFEPAYNVTLGTRYLTDQLRGVAEGRFALALAAYNAGPHRVKAWKEKGFASADLLTWIERIPFRETREYVSAILRNRHWFARLHGDDTLDAREALWKPARPATKTAD